MPPISAYKDDGDGGKKSGRRKSNQKRKKGRKEKKTIRNSQVVDFIATLSHEQAVLQLAQVNQVESVAELIAAEVLHKRKKIKQ